MDNLSLVWDEFTDSTFRNAIHKLKFTSEGFHIESKIIGFTEVDKNLLFQSLSEGDELENLFTELGLNKPFVKISEIFNSILLINKFEFIEGGINDKYKVKTGMALSKFCKINNIKETEFTREF